MDIVNPTLDPEALKSLIRQAELNRRSLNWNHVFTLMVFTQPFNRARIRHWWQRCKAEHCEF